MAVTIADITKLRKLSGAGLADCKKALEEANNDIEAAMEIIRKKGQAVAAKRSDRETSEGCVLCKVADGFGAIIALKCETDFVAQNKDFVQLTQDILDAAVAAKCKTLDDVKALPMGKGTIADAVVNRSGITGEKMELDGYNVIEGACVEGYNHMGKNGLCTLVAFSKEVPADVRHNVAMQVAAMNPISLTETDVPEHVRKEEYEIAADKARQEGKPENMIERIAEGRMKKFYKESCLLDQEFYQDTKISVDQYVKQADKGCDITGFRRFTLRAE
jgi:elongation factor Ts